MLIDINAMLNQAIQDFRQGSLEEAKKKLKNVLDLQPSNLVALEAMGILLANLRNPQEALEYFEKITIIRPNYFLAWTNHGNALQELKKYEQALVSYDKAISIKSDHADTWYNRGNALQELKQYKLALASFDKAISYAPNDVDAWSKRGNSLQDLKLYEQALASFDKAISIKPEIFEVWSNRGNVLQDLKQYDLALASYDKALNIKPDFADAWYNRGNASKELKKYEQALVSYDKAISIKLSFADAWLNRGNVLQDLKLYEQALASLDKAISIKPDCVEAWSSRGNVLQDLKQYELALASHDKAISINPDDAQSYYNRSLLRLMLKKFEEGYKDYKYRWESKEQLGKRLKTSMPSILQSRLEGRLFLWAEQGLGDEVFYAGLLPMLLAKDVSITLSADQRLHSIYKRSFPEITLINKSALTNPYEENEFDGQAPIGDLGCLLGINEASITINRSPYLVTDAVKREKLSKEFSKIGPSLVCGLAWKSSNEKIGIAKSISLSSFEPILNLSGIQFVNLQYGDVSDDIQQIKSKLSVDIHQVPGIDLFHDVDSLLALIDACDVVVTTSNVTAHLAGAIGKRSAVLVPYSNGRIWYWHDNDQDSFWYPSLRLFYQDNPLSWQQQLSRCADWVKDLVTIGTH